MLALDESIMHESSLIYVQIIVASESVDQWIHGMDPIFDNFCGGYCGSTFSKANGLEGLRTWSLVTDVRDRVQYEVDAPWPLILTIASPRVSQARRYDGFTINCCILR